MNGTAAQPGVATARIIAASLAMGVVGLWIAAWFVTAGGANPVAPDALAPGLAFWVWGAAALAGLAGALAFRGRALAGRDARASHAQPVTGAELGRVQTYLIIAWALLEGPALLGGVLFMITGSTALLLPAALVYLIGFVLTFPRAEWFGAHSRS